MIMSPFVKKEEEDFGDDDETMMMRQILLDEKFGGSSRRTIIGRRKIEMYLHELNRCDIDSNRLRTIMDCVGVGGEDSIAKQIVRNELEVLRLQHQQQQQEEDDEDGHHDEDCCCSFAAISELEKAEVNNDIPMIITVMKQDIYLYNITIQVAAMNALNRLLLLSSSYTNNTTTVDTTTTTNKNSNNNNVHNVRSQIVNAGGIDAITTSMKIHMLTSTAASKNSNSSCYERPPPATSSSVGASHLLRVGAAILIRLPFLNSRQHCFVDRNGMYHDTTTTSSSSSTTGRTTAATNPLQDSGGGCNDECIDFSVVEIMMLSSPKDETNNKNAISILRECTENNLFHVAYQIDGDLVGNHERTLASEQIPTVCNNILLQCCTSSRPTAAAAAANSLSSLSSYCCCSGTGSSSSCCCCCEKNKKKIQQMKLLRKRFLYLRSCLASLLQDKTITKDTLRLT